jgi:hypothetical protein
MSKTPGGANPVKPPPDPEATGKGAILAPIPLNAEHPGPAPEQEAAPGATKTTARTRSTPPSRRRGGIRSVADYASPRSASRRLTSALGTLP